MKKYYEDYDEDDYDYDEIMYNLNTLSDYCDEVREHIGYLFNNVSDVFNFDIKDAFLNELDKGMDEVWSGTAKMEEAVGAILRELEK